MIPVASSVTQTDTLPGRRREFGITDVRWVMRSLADLYSNKELAVTREYSTNARDAMVEAGKADQAIEVTLPSMMDPYFKVRDFGEGMSADTLLDVYTQFGESTKRDSNEFNGMLGFGCKSAIAYTDSFTVTSIRDGLKSVAVITRSPDYSIEMNLVMEAVPTNEASGTEVVVPVYNWQEFAHKAQDFYKFWMPGTVLVNGAFPQQAVGEKLADNLYYSADNSYYSGTSYVVMGNVAYRINNPEALFRESRMNRIHFVAYVDNGAVEFTPSREDLKYTDHTKATLHKVIADFEDTIISTAKAEIDEAETHFEAYAKWVEWTNKLGKALFGDLDFNGDKFEDTFKIDAIRYKPNAYSYSTHRVTQWDVSSANMSMFITGFTKSTGLAKTQLTSSDKAKAREYASMKGIRTSFFLFTDDEVKSPWINTNTERFVDWEDLKAALPKKPKKARAVATKPGRIPGTFDFWTQAGKHYEQEIPEDKTIYYILAKEQRPKNEDIYDPANVLRLTNEDAVVVLLGANRVEKFKRENPKVKHFLTEFKGRVVIDGKSLLTDEAKEMLSIGSDTREWIHKMDTSKVDDPAFKRASDLLDRKEALLKAYNDNLLLARSVGMWYTVKEHSINTEDNSLMKRYPLLDALRYTYGGRVQMDHIYIYLNAAYAAEKKEN